MDLEPIVLVFEVMEKHRPLCLPPSYLSSSSLPGIFLFLSVLNRDYLPIVQ